MKIIRTYYCKTLRHIVNVYEPSEPSLRSIAPIYSKSFRQNQSPAAKPSIAASMSKTQLRNIRFFKLMKRGPA